MKQYIATQVRETTAGGDYVLRKDYEKLLAASLELISKIESGADAADTIRTIRELQ